MSVCITPWKDHPEFVDDWLHATSGFTERVVILEGDVKFPEDVKVIQRDPDLSGYGAIVNVGFRYCLEYLKLQREVIILCNNDIKGEPFEANILPGGLLVGPALLHTGVHWRQKYDAGFNQDGLPELPYLDGWCLMARASTWQVLGNAPYPELPGFYWEDTLMQQRMVAKGVRLGVFKLPWQHMVGATTNDRPNIDDEFWANREYYKNEVYGG